MIKKIPIPLRLSDRKLLDLISTHVRETSSNPTICDLMGKPGFRSVEGIRRGLKRLTDGGYIKRDSGAGRSISLLNIPGSNAVPLPSLVTYFAKCGRNGEVAYTVKTNDLNHLQIKSGDLLFVQQGDDLRSQLVISQNQVMNRKQAEIVESSITGMLRVVSNSVVTA